MNIQNPHDKFFKETLSDVAVAKDFVLHYVPQEILQVLDIQTLHPQKDSFINEDLKEYFSDLLFKVNISQKESYIYFLFEHKSYSDSSILFQLLKYMVEIWETKQTKEKAKTLPIILPIVIYHGAEQWKPSSRLADLLEGYADLPEAVKVYVPNFDYLLYNLPHYSDNDIKGAAKTKIALTLLRDIKTKEGADLLNSIIKAIHYLSELEDQQTSMGYLTTMLRYIFSAAKNLTEEQVDKIKVEIETNHPKGSGLAMTLAEQWMEEGKSRGVAEGLVQGQQLALSQMAVLQFTNKLGALPKEVKEGLTNADLPTLQVLLTNVFTIEHVDDIRKYIQ